MVARTQRLPRNDLDFYRRRRSRYGDFATGGLASVVDNRVRNTLIVKSYLAVKP